MMVFAYGNVVVKHLCYIYYSVILTVLSFMLISVYSANLSKSIGESIGIAIAILFKFGIGIGIANTFTRKYWYWYCQYFFPVLLTALYIISYQVKSDVPLMIE